MDLNPIQGSGTTTYALPQSNNKLQDASQPAADGQSRIAVAREAEIAASSALQTSKVLHESPDVQQKDTVQLKTSMVKNLDTVKAIEQMHSRLNELVKGVRQSNEELNKAAEQVGQMQGHLMTIVKNYPPYPIESLERRELLMSYMSLRKEIESMMFPPPPQPVYEKVRSMWDAMFAQNGQILASAVPALESGSSDKQVQTAAIAVGETSEQLASLSDSITQALLQP